MGFDVVYLTPIHPIGTTARKGPNNTLERATTETRAAPTPSAHRTAGTTRSTPTSAPSRTSTPSSPGRASSGLEVALDIALQCSPDHPYVTEHPEWFTTRADGTIAYAENPPKKYQDIYPLNFDNDPAGAYAEMRRVIQVWLDHGVRIFRVDNPHTKPVQFWQWLIQDVAAGLPRDDLAGRGLHQAGDDAHPGQGRASSRATRTTPGATPSGRSRSTSPSSSGDAAAYMRPSFWPTTHDILTPYMQFGGPAAWKLRAALAATLVPTYGIYAGYELIEHVARPGVEEQIDNEKYQFKDRRWEDYEPGGPKEGQSLAPYLTRLNEIRRAHPALHRLRNIVFHHVDDENVIAFSKRRVRRRRRRPGRGRRHRRREPRPAQHPGDDGAPRPGGARPRPRARASSPRTSSPGRAGRGAGTTTSGSGPDGEPVHIIAVRRY